MKYLQVSDFTIACAKQQYKLNTVRAQRKSHNKCKSYNKSPVDDTVVSIFQQKLIDTLNDYNHKYVMNSDQTRIQQSVPPVYTIHQTKNKVHKAMKHALNTDERPSILISCVELHKAIHDMRLEDEP